MTLADIYAKLRHYYRLAMESPLDSAERTQWSAILRDLENMKNALTVEAAKGA